MISFVSDGRIGNKHLYYLDRCHTFVLVSSNARTTNGAGQTRAQ